MNETGNSEYLYSLKKSLITECEKSFFDAIRRSLPNGYFLQPQVNLASIIVKKKSFAREYQNELNRNIDACIFDLNWKPIVLIEINDSTHNRGDRRKRDKKVGNICKEAGIQIITFWTKYGVDYGYISSTVNNAIQNAENVKREHCFEHDGFKFDNRTSYANESNAAFTAGYASGFNNQTGNTSNSNNQTAYNHNMGYNYSRTNTAYTAGSSPNMEYNYSNNRTNYYNVNVPYKDNKRLFFLKNLLYKMIKIMLGFFLAMMVLAILSIILEA